jgi:hypothetical protein
VQYNEEEICIEITWFLEIWTLKFDGDKSGWMIKEEWYNDDVINYLPFYRY